MTLHHFLLIYCSLSWTIFNHCLAIDRTLEDVKVPVGSLFNMTIPETAFPFDVKYFQVSEAGSDALPNWLAYSDETRSIYGVPNSWDNLLIPRYHVSVVAHGETKKAQQVFTVHIIEDGSLLKGNPKSFRDISSNFPSCSYNQRVKSMVLFPVKDHRSMTPKEKANFILNQARLTQLEVSRFRLLDTTYVKGFTDFRILTSFNETFHELIQDQPCLLLVLGCPEGDDSSYFKILGPYIKEMQETGRNDDNGKINAIIIESRLSNEKTVQRRQRQSLVLPQGRNFWSTPEPEPDLLSSTTTPLPTTSRQTKSTRKRRPSAGSTSSRWTATPTPEIMSSHLTSDMAMSSAPPTSRSTKRASIDFTLPSPVTKRPFDEGPVVRNSMDSFICYQHILCVKEIGPSTFSDQEDGPTINLHLKLKTTKSPTGAKNDWLTLNARQELIGIPMHVGVWDMQLSATDSATNVATDAFRVIVEPKLNINNLNHEFFVTLNLTYDQFSDDIEKQILFVKRMSNLLGDSDASNVSLNGISPNAGNPGTSLVRWSNVSLAQQPCPREDVNVLLKSQQLPLFRDRMNRKEFPFISVIRDFSKECGGRSPTPVRFPDPSGKTSSSDDVTDSKITTVAPNDKETLSSDNFFLATILPIIIISLLLCIALTVACVLYQKSKRSKKHSSLLLNGGDPRSEFVSKGAPVIFPDEVDHLDEDAALKSVSHTPMLLKDEKPPLAPPDFNGQLNGYDSAAPPSGVAGAPSRGPNSERSYGPAGYQSPLSVGRQVKKPPTTGDDTEMTTRPLLQDFDENPLYRAPPPFEPAGLSSKHHDGRSPRPKHTSPQQREPPPYVPP